MFFGRREELFFLEEKYESNKSEFVVVYGRRRIGKTALIKEFIKDKDHIFYSSVQITDLVQLQKMSGMVSKHFELPKYMDRFSDWEMLFQFIGDSVDKGNDEKLVLVIDEFPYMVMNNKSIPSVLQKIWDLQYSESNIMVILCGSSMSFMEKEVLSEKNPLYGRTTGLLKIKELDFNSARKFMANVDVKIQMAYFSIFSGVPYYLNFINESKTLEDNIKSAILNNGSVLFNEVEFLLKQELREVAQYNAIIESIAVGDTKINEIYQKTGIEKTKLPYYISSLMDLGIVTKEYPATIKIKEQSKKRSGIYKLDNSYFKFYYSMVYPYLSELSEGNEDVILEEVILKRLSSFVSYEFEKLAIRVVREMGKNKTLPIRPIKIGRWWRKNVEIDIVAFDVNNNFLVGECKWTKEKIGKKILDELKEKVKHIEQNMLTVSYILFSKSGFTEELLKEAEGMKDLILFDFGERYK